MPVKATGFFKVYEQALRAAGAIDFADMVPLLVGAMDKHPAYASAMTGAFDHLLVDEYQDVNPGQVELIDRFVQAGVKLWVVGDDDQTLYAFRAADVRFILDFPRSIAARAFTCSTALSLGRTDRRRRQAADRHNRARRDKDYKPVIDAAGEIVIRGYARPISRPGRWRKRSPGCSRTALRRSASRSSIALVRSVYRCSRLCRRSGFPTRCVAPAISGKAWRRGWWSERSTICVTENRSRP
jgi:hypothetical protein